MNLKNQKILITGHTGFVGSWLYLYLKQKKIDVYGIGLKPKNKGSIFKILELYKDKNSKILDILDYKKLKNHIKKIKPNIIVHLAAQSLVLKSFSSPNHTIYTNVIGTLNILNLVKELDIIKTAVFFTTDKVYKNDDKKKKFSENNALGGDDPYSASKSASEIIINSYYKSYFKQKKIIVLRAGNIIGGGDVSDFRIIPDIVKAIKQKKTLIVRNLNSTRPWQYIMDTIDIIFKILKKINKKRVYKIYNISPNSKTVPVNYIIKEFQKNFNFNLIIKKNENIEKKFLELNSNKIFKELKLKNFYSSKASINRVISFYNNSLKKKKSLKELMNSEFKDYEKLSKNN